MKRLIATYIAALILTGMPLKNTSGTNYSINVNQKPLLKFGIITDVHYSDNEPVETRFYRSSLRKINEALTVFREDSVDFVINLGDLIDKDFRSYKPAMTIIDSFGLQIYHVSGNHDFSVKPYYKKKIPALEHEKKGYYSFSYSNFRFIFLNGNEISTYISANKKTIKNATDYICELKDKGEVNAIEWNGGISSKQLDWLSEQLTQATEKGEKVIISCHFPVIPENIHNLLNYNDILTVLKRFNNIIAWFNGHNHAGNYGNINHIHFVTFKGMVETENTNSFSEVEVYRNKIWIKGFGREKNQILAY